ncbi:MAG TPA: DUF4160 domain-containing protein [Allosphingosinicella sp.]|jgi:hypothetical protein
MVTVHREGGFRVAIYRNDHEPAHVHVIKDGEVIVDLVGPDRQPEVRDAYGATKADVRKSLQIVTGERQYLLRKWQEIRDGTD